MASHYHEIAANNNNMRFNVTIELGERIRVGKDLVGLELR